MNSVHESTPEQPNPLLTLGAQPADAAGATAKRIKPMRAHEGIEENLRFLIIEVEKQLQRTGASLAKPNKGMLL